MARKGGLGRGLDSLIPGDTSLVDSGALMLSVDKITTNPSQPRQTLIVGDLQELADSIREHGVLQPLIVSFSDTSDQYTLVAGERRLRAAIMAGLDMVPVLVRQVTDQERLELALVENIQRSDLTPLETAEAYRHLSEDFHLSHDEIARQVGKNRVTVTNTLRLLNLAEIVRQALANEKISEGHARALLALSSFQAQDAALATILKLNLTVRQTEELVRNLNGEKSPSPARRTTPPEILALEERLRTHLGTRVNLKHGSHGGSLTIHYYSDEELNGLIDKILKE